MSQPRTVRALVVCHPGNLSSGHAGAEWDAATLVVAALGLGGAENDHRVAVADETDIEEFFAALDLDHLDAHGPWVLELAVAGGGTGWTLEATRRPTDGELVDAMYARAGWRVL